MVRFGIAGFGLHAVKRLMPGFADARLCRVTALSRRDLDQARASAARFGIPHAFASVEELCTSPDVDAVFVTSPDALHLEHALAAINAGKAVLCEKPMAMNAEEARHMVAAAAAAGVLLGVAQVFRFERSVNRLRERIQRGDIGRVVYASAQFSYTAQGHARTWIQDPKLACGGPIADVGVHCIDALRYMLGDEIASVKAKDVGWSGALETKAALLLQFRSGTVGAVLVSAIEPYATPVEIIGEGGTLRAMDAFNVEKPITIQLIREGRIVESEAVDNRDAYAQQVDSFARAVMGGVPFTASGKEGLRNQLVLDAAYESARTGANVIVA